MITVPLAGRVLRKEEAGYTLQTTALVNETYLKMAGNNLEVRDRNHFT